MPERERWWTENVGRYVTWGVERKGWVEATTGETVRKALRLWPRLLAAAGFPGVYHARDITPEMLRAWRTNPRSLTGSATLRQTTASEYLRALGPFLKWSGSTLPDEWPILFRLQRGASRPKDRRDSATIERLYSACRTDAERLLIAAFGWAGLRVGGLHDLVVRDVDLDLSRPSVVARMKGGRRVVLPISVGVVNALRPFVVGKASDARVWPYKNRRYCWVMLARICQRAGVPRMYPHALRATFGAVLRFERGVATDTIRQLYGHTEERITRIYIGEDLADMRAAINSFRTGPTAKAAVAEEA